MSKVHGKNTYVSVNSVDISAYCTSCEFGRTGDAHDVTTFGNNSHRKQGGLYDGTVSLEGIYESVSVSGGPPAIFPSILNTVVPLVYRPEGTGSGKAQRSVSVLLTTYNESSPVADMITWSAEGEFDGDVSSTTQ